MESNKTIGRNENTAKLSIRKVAGKPVNLLMNTMYTSIKKINLYKRSIF